MSQCRSCKAPVEWAVTDAGRRIPLDVERFKNGNITLVGGRAVVGASGSGDRISHFATCPNAKEHRR